MIELTIPFDAIMQEAARKKGKCKSLVTTIQKKGYSVTLIAIEVGTRRLPHKQGFNRSKQHLEMSKNTTRGL